jgi:hypothetical protein
MRVVRTDTFFDKPQLSWEVAPLAKSISTAWFKDENSGYGSLDDLSTLLMPGHVEGPNADIKGFLEECLMYGVGGNYVNPAIFKKVEWLKDGDVDYALNIPVVIEQSPPMSLPLTTLVSKAPGIAIGTFIGYQIGAEHPALMLLTVPGGILAVSSAIGIAKTLERGLHSKVEAMFKNKRKAAA